MITVALIRRYLRPYRAALWAVAALLLVQAFGTLFLPYLNARIINDGVVTGDLGVIGQTGALMLGISLVVGVVSVGATYLAARNAMGFGRDVRSSLFRTVDSFSLSEMNRFGAPSLITRNTNDVQQVQMLVLMGQTMMISAPMMLIGGVFMALHQNVQLSALLLIVIPVMAVVVGSILFKAVPLSRVMQAKLDTINDVLRENLTGIRVIRAFVRTDYERKRFEAANDDITDVTLRLTRWFALMMPSLMLVFNLSAVAVVWFGGQLIGDGEMPIGDLTAFLSYIMQILFSVMMAVMLFLMVPRAAASAERIQRVLGTEPSIRDPQQPRITKGAGTVEFRDVEFRYPGAEEPVLCGVSLTLEPGRTTAIVGSTGSGKSTLINLIPRLFDVTGGQVLVNGVDVREQEQEVLWSGIGFVPQKAFLFSGTVADNVRLGRRDASDDEVWQALATAQAADFVAGNSDGLEHQVDQGGANLSGGQRQRLSIARALVRHTPIYIFDDSFSALDYTTDARLRTALRRDEYTRAANVVIVAQRISTILHADQIVVLDHGRVVGLGTHDELLSVCETYREIVLSQMDESDVAGAS